ncbi:hypothetical protein K445DRAFT_18100 [Daldinia sp. EC12]|nr:hypothetical protein K445DRAFT_18100 [Daldinia sp. EC12]
MTENHGAPPFNGPHRAQVPTPLAGTGGRPVGQPQVPMHQQAFPPRGGFPPVKISDVRRGLMTIDDMREELAEYILFRFEKYPTQSRYDDEGRLRHPTWDQAIISQIQSMSTEEIRRRIQYLNRKTRAPTDKLKTLNPVLQRQIDKATEELRLQNPDPMNYYWVLVQLDHQLAEIKPYVSVAAGNHPQSRRHYSIPRRQAHRHEKENTPRSFKRVSLTTYFKRVPKAEADIPALYEAKRTMRFSQNNHTAHLHAHTHTHAQPQQPQQQQQQQPQPQPQPQSQAQPQPYRGPGHRTPPSGPGPVEGRPPSGPNTSRPQPIPSHPNGSGPGPRPGLGTKGPPMNNSAGGSGEKVRSAGVKHTKIESESDSSDYSSSDRSFDSQMTLDTSYSSESLNRGRGRGRGRNKNYVAARSLSRKRDRNGFGQDLSEHHRGHHHRTHNNHSDIGHGATMPPLRTSSIDIHRVIDDAYLAGVLRERNERARREARYSRLNPRITSGSRLSTAPYGRYKPTSDRQGDIDDEISRLNDLSIGDEDDYDAVLRRVDSRRRREFEYLVHEGSVLEEDPFDRERPSYLRHSDRPYEESYLTDDSDSEDSLPRRRRRRRRRRFYY